MIELLTGGSFPSQSAWADDGGLISSEASVMLLR